MTTSTLGKLSTFVSRTLVMDWNAPIRAVICSLIDFIVAGDTAAVIALLKSFAAASKCPAVKFAANSRATF